MTTQKSDLISKICNLNLENRYFKDIIVKGHDYYIQGKVKYVFSPKQEELIAVVSGTEDYVVYFELSGGNINMECTCPTKYTCKHEVATMFYIKDNSEYLQEECGLDNAISSSAYPEIIELYTFLKRLVGPKNIVIQQTIMDFEIYSNRLAYSLVKKLRSNIDKTVTCKSVLQFIELMSTVSFFKNERKLNIAQRIVAILEAMFELTVSSEMGFLNALDKYINENNLPSLITWLKKYSEDYDTNEMYCKIVDIVIAVIEKSSYQKSHSSLDYLEDIIILKANNLFMQDKEKFINYAIGHIDIPCIRILVLKTLYKDNKYNEIIEIWEKYNNNITLINNEETSLYLQALKDANNSNLVDTVINLFANNPVYDFYLLLKEKQMFTNKDLLNNIISIASNHASVVDYIKILNDLGDKNNVFDVCMKIRNTNERITMFHNNFKSLLGINDERLLTIFQNDIISTYNREKTITSVIQYIDDLKLVKMGKFYQFEMLQYLSTEKRLNYEERKLVLNYISNLGV